MDPPVSDELAEHLYQLNLNKCEGYVRGHIDDADIFIVCPSLSLLTDVLRKRCKATPDLSGKVQYLKNARYRSDQVLATTYTELEVSLYTHPLQLICERINMVIDELLSDSSTAVKSLIHDQTKWNKQT